MKIRAKSYLICALFLISLVACNNRGYKETVLLDRQVNVTNEWTEIRIPKPLTPEYPVQEVTLKIGTPYSRDTNRFRIRFADGSEVVPEVLLVDDAGKSYSLGSLGFYGDDIFLTGKQDLPQRPITAVRIRCDRNFVLLRAAWLNYDPSLSKR